MELKQLQLIKSVYDGLAQGVSNPIQINSAYGYLPNHIDGAPMRAKIQAITRFVMLNYADEIQAIAKAEKEAVQLSIIESIGTIENQHKQSHKESVADDMATEHNENRQFLTKEEKADLANPLTGTALEIVSNDGKKRRTRTKKT